MRRASPDRHAGSPCSGLKGPPRRATAALFAIALAAGSAHAAAPKRAPPPADVLGTWTTQDGNGVIAIERCGDALCGRIVGIRRAPGAPIPKDVHGASQCGLTIITNQRATADGEWRGQIIDPRDGTTYGAKLWRDRRGNLRVRGYLGLPLFGQTQTWRRFDGTIAPGCRPA